MTLMRELFFAHDGLPCDKWHHYLDVYERHLHRLKNLPVRLLEIGVQGGGSLQLWRKFFGPGAIIHGLDIDPTCAALVNHGLEVHIGDQSNARDLRNIVKQMGGVDIIIDDGGHVNDAQCATWETLYPMLSERGVYICEDVHTSYWQAYGGGLGRPHSFVEMSKLRIDDLNAYHNDLEQSFARMTDSIHFYDSMVVFERGSHPPPIRSVQGSKESA